MMEEITCTPKEFNEFAGVAANALNESEPTKHPALEAYIAHHEATVAFATRILDEVEGIVGVDAAEGVVHEGGFSLSWQKGKRFVRVERIVNDPYWRWSATWVAGDLRYSDQWIMPENNVVCVPENMRKILETFREEG